MSAKQHANKLCLLSSILILAGPSRKKRSSAKKYDGPFRENIPVSSLILRPFKILKPQTYKIERLHLQQESARCALSGFIRSATLCLIKVLLSANGRHSERSSPETPLASDCKTSAAAVQQESHCTARLARFLQTTNACVMPRNTSPVTRVSSPRLDKMFDLCSVC